MFQRKLNRVMPELAAHNMITHQIAAPLATHWRRATCEEVGCLAHHHGWSYHASGMPAEVTDAVKRSNRRYRVERDENTGDEVLHFEAGQPCFQASTHRIRIERPELFVVCDGDWRGNPRKTEPQILSGADAWADSLHTRLDMCRDGA